MNTLAQVDEEHRGDVAIARVRGEIDASNAEWIGARVRAMLTNRTTALALDLTETTYLDSAGIALTFALGEELRMHQQQLHVVIADGSPIARMLALAGIGQALPVHVSLDAAMAGAG